MLQWLIANQLQFLMADRLLNLQKDSNETLNLSPLYCMSSAGCAMIVNYMKTNAK